MSSKTDSGDGGKGAPLTKPKVGGGYRRRYPKTRREKKSVCNKVSKSYLQRIHRGPQESHLQRGNRIPSGSIYRNYQGPGDLCQAEVRQYSGHPDRNRASEGHLDTYPNHKNVHQRGSGKAPPWELFRRVRQAHSMVIPKQSENILRGPVTMHRGNK